MTLWTTQQNTTNEAANNAVNDEEMVAEEDRPALDAALAAALQDLSDDGLEDEPIDEAALDAAWAAHEAGVAEDRRLFARVARAAGQQAANHWVNHDGDNDDEAGNPRGAAGAVCRA